MKSIIYKIISGILFPVAFVSLFFVIGGTEHGTTCWIGFASIILSYVMLIAVPLFIPNSQSSYLFGTTSGTVTGIFFSVQFVIGLIFVICDFDKWKIALIIDNDIFYASAISNRRSNCKKRSKAFTRSLFGEKLVA